MPYARGREVYRDHNEVIKEVKDLLNRGYKEITLIAQNVNSYISSDKKTDFADLLKMVNDLDGDFWLRFSTSHPKDMSDKLINTMVDCNKLCHHLHLPAQAGNNYILRAMNRKYSIEDYLALIKKVKNKISDMSFTTDIIVGFPGETGEQFKDTKKLFEKVGYDMAYIAQYSPRPGTMAEKLKDDVSNEEKKKREEELMAILRKTSKENNKKYLHKKIKVLVEGKNKKGEFFGKAENYKSIKFLSNNRDLIGSIVEIEIDEVNDFGLFGKIKNA